MLMKNTNLFQELDFERVMSENVSIKSRAEKMEHIWHNIHGHGTSVPLFLWDNYPVMEYSYNEQVDAIICNDISVPIDIPTEELTEQKIITLIDDLEFKVYNEYKTKHNIDLGFMPYLS